MQNKEIKRIQSGGKAGFLFSTYIQLFFVLFYLKNYMTFDVSGSIFGFTSAEAHKHVDSLLPVLAQALSSSGHLPATQFSSPEELRKALGSSLEALIDATECQCVRPSDIGLTHGFEALAECHQLVNNHTKLNGIDGFSSSSFKYLESRFFFSA